MNRNMAHLLNKQLQFRLTNLFTLVYVETLPTDKVI